MRVPQGSLSAISVAALCVASTGAIAQIDEILVTAQKREQSIRDVPISMVAFQGVDILDQQITGLEDLAYTLPNVQISKDTISNNIYMRGVGSGVSPGFEQAVAIFVDGSYRGRSRYTNSTLVDIERVEVLRGPQTTYFGNNAIAGAFSVTTKGPDLDAWNGYGQASYEFVGEEPVVEAAVGGPIVQDKFGIRVAGRFSRLEGFLDNQGTGGQDPTIKDRFGRLSAQLQLAPEWSAAFKAEYGRQTSDGAFAAQLFNCPAPGFAPSGSCTAAIAAGQEDDLDFNRVSNGDERGEIEASEFIWNLQRDNDVGHGFFVQATHSRGDFVISGDTDLTTEDRVTFSNIEANKQTTVEVRLDSPSDSKLQYTLGAYYLDSEYSFSSNFNLLFLTPTVVPFIAGGLFSAAAPFAPFTVDSNIFAEETAFSFFGSATWPFTDNFSATVGLRYINSDKSAVQDSQPKTTNDRYGFSTDFITEPAALGAASALTQTAAQSQIGSVQDDDILPSVTLAYEPNENANLYFKYSDGFKAGGFDPLERSGVPGRLTYDPETVHAYEVGLKSIWLNDTLSFNVALFRSDYKDLQQAVVQFAGGGAFVVTQNVGGLTSQGAEIEVAWEATENLTFSADAAFLDAFYKDYPNGGCNVFQEAVTPVNCVQDLSGVAPPFAPNYAGVVRASYEQPIINSSLVFSGDVALSFSDGYSLAPDNDPVGRQGSWQKVDLRLGLSDADANWSLAFIGKNLANERVFATANDVVGTAGSYFATIERGRFLALQARYNFN